MTERDPLWVQGGNYTATEDRLALAALFGARHFVDLAPSTSPLVSAGGGHGVVGSADMAVTAGAGTTVNVAAGLAVVRGTQQSDQGVYVTSNDAAKSLTISAADATNPRKDLIVSRVKDAEFGIAGDTGPLEVVAGTATGGLTAGNATGRPTPPENALILAEVFVPAGAASSASYTITDLRTRATALGGAFVAASSATYPSPATEGMEVIDLALDQKLIYNGSAWVPFGAYGAWTTYSPTWRAGTTALAHTRLGGYEIKGKALTFRASIAFTGAAGAAGAITVGLPAGVALKSGMTQVAPVFAYDSGTTNYRGVAVGGLLIANYDRMQVFINDSAAAMTDAAPFVIANGDFIAVSGAGLEID
jgi:hypothetical protein